MPGQLTRLTSLDTTRTAQTPRPRLRPRGLPPALEPYGVYTASNPADAALFGNDLLGTHRVKVAPADTRSFVATYHAVLLRDITLGYLDYGTDVTVEIHQSTPDQLVVVPATGSSTVVIDNNSMETSPVHAVTLPPGGTARIECDRHTAHLVVRIDSGALCRHVSRLTGRPVVDVPRFEPLFDLTSPTASRWNAAIQMLHAELLDDGSLINQGAGISQLEEFVMSALLYSHQSDLSAELAGPRRTERETVRIAVEYMAARLGAAITIDDVAATAGITVRTLQQHFRTDLGLSPTAHLRNMRLDRAREELADASVADHTTVADVATRWGLTHLGRFSAAYRERFGELPSQTLRN